MGFEVAAHFFDEEMAWETWVVLNLVTSPLYSFLSSDFFHKTNNNNNKTILSYVHSPISVYS